MKLKRKTTARRVAYLEGAKCTTAVVLDQNDMVITAGAFSTNEDAETFARMLATYIDLPAPKCSLADLVNMATDNGAYQGAAIRVADLIRDFGR